MDISLIHDAWVNEDKTLKDKYVSTSYLIDDLSEFAQVALLCHIVPGTFLNNIKTQSNFIQTQLLCFDFDNGTKSQEVIDYLKYKYDFVILASKNHLINKNDGKGIVERFHVFILLKDKIEDVAFYKFVANNFARIAKWNVDKNCLEASRYFYRHKEILFLSQGNRPMELGRFVEMKKLQDTLQTIIHKSKVHSGQEDSVASFKRTKAFQQLERGDLNTDGNRYSNSSAIIGVMIKCGLDLHDALSLFDQYSTYGKSYTRDSVERRYRQWS